MPDRFHEDFEDEIYPPEMGEDPEEPCPPSQGYIDRWINTEDDDLDMDEFEDDEWEGGDSDQEPPEVWYDDYPFEEGAIYDDDFDIPF